MRPLLLIFPVIGIAAQEQNVCKEEDEADASEVSSERQHKRPVLLFHDKWRKESEIRKWSQIKTDFHDIHNLLTTSSTLWRSLAIVGCAAHCLYHTTVLSSH